MSANSNENPPNGGASGSEADTKKCWACTAPLNAEQIFCTDCSNWQNGVRRYLPFSSSVLSLLVALVAVIAGTVQPIARAIHGDPDPRLYIFGALNENWEQLVLTVENLNHIARVLPTLIECKTFGAVADVTSSLRFYNVSPTLIRGNERMQVSYRVDPKTKLPEEYSIDSEALSGLNCKGALGAGDEDFSISVVLNNEQSINPGSVGN